MGCVASSDASLRMSASLRSSAILRLVEDVAINRSLCGAEAYDAARLRPTEPMGGTAMRRSWTQVQVGLKLLVPLLVFAVLAMPASATAPTSASGTFVATQVVTSVRSADGNTFINTNLTETITGTYNGAISGESHLVLHADGSGNLHGEFTCICTIAGQGTGTLTFRFAGTGEAGTFEGQYRVVGSSGGLAGTHGLGQFRVTGTAGSYSGSQHSEP